MSSNPITFAVRVKITKQTISAQVCVYIYISASTPTRGNAEMLRKPQ